MFCLATACKFISRAAQCLIPIKTCCMCNIACFIWIKSSWVLSKSSQLVLYLGLLLVDRGLQIFLLLRAYQIVIAQSPLVVPACDSCVTRSSASLPSPTLSQASASKALKRKTIYVHNKWDLLGKKLSMFVLIIFVYACK